MVMVVREVRRCIGERTDERLEPLMQRYLGGVAVARWRIVGDIDGDAHAFGQAHVAVEHDSAILNSSVVDHGEHLVRFYRANGGGAPAKEPSPRSPSPVPAPR